MCRAPSCSTVCRAFKSRTHSAATRTRTSAAQAQQMRRCLLRRLIAQKQTYSHSSMPTPTRATSFTSLSLTHLNLNGRRWRRASNTEWRSRVWRHYNAHLHTVRVVCVVLSALCAILRYAQSSSSTIGSASTRTARRWGSLRPPRRRRSAAATAATARARHGHRPKTTNATIFLKSVFVQHIPPTPHRPAHLNADADTGEPELFSGDWRCQRALPTVARCAQRVWSSPSTTTTTMRDRAPRRAMAGRGVGAQIRALRK